MSAHGSGATKKTSKLPAAPGILAAAAVGAVLVVTAGLADVVRIRVGMEFPFTESGFDRHGIALALLAAAALVLAALRSGAGTWPPAAGLVLVGAAVVAIAFGSDLPATHQTGVFGLRYEHAAAVAGAGLWLELAGGVVLCAAGLIGLAPLARRAR